LAEDSYRADLVFTHQEAQTGYRSQPAAIRFTRISSRTARTVLSARMALKYQAERVHMAIEHTVLGHVPGLTGASAMPFVLVFQARTGSNMVRTALDAHSNIRCYRELFRSRSDARAGRGAVGVPSRALPILLDDPAEFLDSYLFGPQPPSVKAVGFKLAYGHAREPEWLPVWQYLAENHIPIVELWRRDSLAVLCSIERARATGHFVARSHTRQSTANLQVHISIERCEAFFGGSANRRKEADDLFVHNPRLLVEYEALVNNWEAQTNQIQDFIGAPRRSISPATVRQSTSTTRSTIANFDKLQRHFAGTPHAYHFGQHNEAKQ